MIAETYEHGQWRVPPAHSRISRDQDLLGTAVNAVLAGAATPEDALGKAQEQQRSCSDRPLPEPAGLRSRQRGRSATGSSACAEDRPGARRSALLADGRERPDHGEMTFPVIRSGLPVRLSLASASRSGYGRRLG